MRRTLVPVVLGVLLAAGCAGGTSAPPPPAPAPVSAPPATAPPVSPPVSQPAAPSPSGGPAPTAPNAGGSGVSRCTSGRLKASLGPSEGAAGSVFAPLVLTNDGTGTCELRGYPGVSYVAGDDGHQVGPAAAFDGPRGAAIVLAAGRAATPG
ncbi:MAG: hypothetical protein QOK35_541 [Pseudonocardiales bacterium]|nr:hypothetical protein [Pseudonocardiales bacterium]